MKREGEEEDEKKGRVGEGWLFRCYLNTGSSRRRVRASCSLDEDAFGDGGVKLQRS